MYAVIKTGGKQYKVAKDDIITVEKLNAAAGDTVTLDNVLMVADNGSVKADAKALDGATVSAQVMDEGRQDKIVVFKKKRRKGYQRTQGHRQAFTTLKITDISTGGAPKKKSAAKSESAGEKAESGAGAKTESSGTKSTGGTKSGTAKTSQAKTSAGSSKSGTAQKSKSTKSTGTKKASETEAETKKTSGSKSTSTSKSGGSKSTSKSSAKSGSKKESE